MISHIFRRTVCMFMGEIHSNFTHSGVVILWMVNGCNGLSLCLEWRGEVSLSSDVTLPVDPCVAAWPYS